MRLHHLHGVVVLPVNKDMIALTNMLHFVIPDLDINYKGCFHRPCLYTRTNFFSGSQTSNLKTSVSKYFCYSLHSILYFPFHSRSSFSCNRVRTNTVTKWVVKEFDNILIPEEDHGLFYTQEAYVLRWGYEITVVRELEGLTPGSGPFAQDRIYRKKLQEQKEGRAVNADKEEKKTKRIIEDSDSECSETEGDDEYRRILESGGRERCAYFFWQGACSYDPYVWSYDTVMSHDIVMWSHDIARHVISMLHVHGTVLNPCRNV